MKKNPQNTAFDINQKGNVTKVPTIRRLPMYLRILRRCKKDGIESISSKQLAEEMGLEPIGVRKDLSFTGYVGKPRYGYNVIELYSAINSIVAWDSKSEAALVGVGHLGSALSGYSGLKKYGLNIPVAFDIDPAVVGTEINEIPILPLSDLEKIVKRTQLQMGILCVPSEAAQDVANIMIDAGIRGIWNFTPVKLRVPKDVVVQQEDLASGLAVLSVKMGHLFNDDD